MRKFLISLTRTTSNLPECNLRTTPSWELRTKSATSKEQTCVAQRCFTCKVEMIWVVVATCLELMSNVRGGERGTGLEAMLLVTLLELTLLQLALLLLSTLIGFFIIAPLLPAVGRNTARSVAGTILVSLMARRKVSFLSSGFVGSSTRFGGPLLVAEFNPSVVLCGATDVSDLIDFFGGGPASLSSEDEST